MTASVLFGNNACVTKAASENVTALIIALGSGDDESRSIRTIHGPNERTPS